MIPRSYLRARTLITAFILALLLVCTLPRNLRAYLPKPADRVQQDTADSTPSHHEFWRNFHTLLEKYAPDTSPIIEHEKAPTAGFNSHNAPPRPDTLYVPEEDIATMKKAHAGFVRAITDSPPALPYNPGTKGIVSTAGGFYLPVLVISLRMLRRTGSTLPMEIFLSDEEEYEPYICDTVLPSLNARCIILSRILATSPAKIEKYQFKPFAMLFSSFEDILFLDADAFPLEDPAHLFTQDPFLSKGLLTWPDFWASSASPVFYDIAGHQAPPMDLRQSTESGEILLSKKSHTRSLLLATYYNFHGPGLYYPLLSQGAAGEGDKETFVAAATAMGEPFYQVSEPICALGHATEGGMAGSAMAQFNPIQDYALTSRGVWRVRGDEGAAPGVFFIHANFPKFNPATVFERHYVNPAFTDDGGYTRAWTIPEHVVRGFNARVDVERGFWEEILWTACELEDRFESWADYEGICDGVRDYWDAVFGN
jgi:alpha 1,2-mannosyltransferase